jgi:MtN3 and saliva related transmembrane protein
MKEIIAKLFFVGLLCNAALFVPQLWAIWQARSSQGVSIATFAGFCVLQVVGILHGYFQKDKYLLGGMLASLISCGTLTLLAIIFR